MELFKVNCVTCQARLSVRNESLIGQIVACPRCGSMVEVAAPLSASTPTAVAAAAPSPVSPPVAPSFEAEALEPNALETQVPADVPAGVEETLELAASAEALQASAEVARYKMIVWSLAGFCIVTTLVAGVIFTRGDSSANTTAPMPVNIESTAAATPVDATPIVAEVPTYEDLPASVVTRPASEEKTPVQPAAEITTQSEPVTTTETESVVLDEASQQPSSLVATSFDPLDFDPGSLTLAKVNQPNAAKAAADLEAAESESPDQPVAAAEEAPSTLPLVRIGPSAGEDASERDAKKQLALLIPAVKIEQMPLVDCLRLFSQLSGVPVSVTPEQLLMAGITAQKKVSLAANETSLGEMLKQVLEPLHLEYKTRRPQVVVLRQEAAKRREINYPIDDLVAGETSAAQLAGWIEQLVAPSTWLAAGGDGTLETTSDSLRINQTQQVQYQVLIMLERLRLARNLEPRSRYPVKRLAGKPAQLLLSDKLASSTTFTFSQFTPLDEIFVHWQTELGVPLLIDWPALAEADTWPETTIACAINDQPWSDALEKVLEPLGLGWRAATGGAIEITSAEKVQNEMQLELYPLRRNLDSDQLRTLTQRQSADSAGVLLYDSVGKVVLSLQPAATQRAIFLQLQRGQLLASE